MPIVDMATINKKLLKLSLMHFDQGGRLVHAQPEVRLVGPDGDVTPPRTPSRIRAICPPEVPDAACRQNWTGCVTVRRRSLPGSKE